MPQVCIFNLLIVYCFSLLNALIFIYLACYKSFWLRRHSSSQIKPRFTLVINLTFLGPSINFMSYMLNYLSKIF